MSAQHGWDSKSLVMSPSDIQSGLKRNAEDTSHNDSASTYSSAEDMRNEINRLQKANAQLRSTCADSEAEFVIKVNQETQRRTTELNNEVERLHLISARRASEAADWELKMQNVIHSRTAPLQDEISMLKHSLNDYKLRAEAAEEALERHMTSSQLVIDRKAGKFIGVQANLFDEIAPRTGDEGYEVQSNTPYTNRGSSKLAVVTDAAGEKTASRLDKMEKDLSELRRWATQNFTQCSGNSITAFCANIEIEQPTCKSVEVRNIDATKGFEYAQRVAESLRICLDHFDKRMSSRLHTLDEKANYIYKKLKRLRAYRNSSTLCCEQAHADSEPVRRKTIQ